MLGMLGMLGRPYAPDFPLSRFSDVSLTDGQLVSLEVTGYVRLT